MPRDESRQIRVYDPATGKQIVYPSQQTPLPPQIYDPMQYPPHYPMQPMPGYPMQVPQQRPRRRRRKRVSDGERRASFVGVWFAMFIMSWVPCGFGMPGATLLAWGLLGAYTLYRACR